MRDGDHYVVNGAKTFITSGVRADFVTTAVRTGGPGPRRRVSLLVVEAGTPGFTVDRSLRKMGWHCSDTAELSYVDVRVPAANLVGEENTGFYQIAEQFVVERIALAVHAYGIAARSLELTAAYCRERETFGRPLIANQVVRHKLVEMRRQVEVARTYTREVAERHVAGENVIAEACLAKQTACDAATYVCDQAVQLHGGTGYMHGTEVERHYRDARILPIGGGATEVLTDLAATTAGVRRHEPLTSEPLGGEVSLHMDAPPEKVWALVSDVTRIGEFSPETFEAKWTRGSTGPEVGASFTGHVKRNGVGPTTGRPARSPSACRTRSSSSRSAPTTSTVNNWGYRLEPDGDGTKVTEYFRLEPTLPLRALLAVLGHLRGRTNEKGMRTTLERMKAVVGGMTTNREAMLEKLADLDAEHAKAVAGGGQKYVDRHHDRGKLLPRERIELLVDEGSAFLELSPLAGWGSDFAVGASVVTGIGVVEGVECMITANDPTVKGGASNPWTVKKIFRASQIAEENGLPTVALVESGGADLPTQKEIFIPGGKLFRDITRSLGAPSSRPSRWSSATPPPAAPTCPGMSDYTVMVREQAKVFLGGPPLVKMATGEESDDESLGGAEMHARTSGLADYLAEDERDAIRIGRRIVARLNWRKAVAAAGPSLGRAGRRPRRAARPDPDRPQGAVRPARGDRAGSATASPRPTARSSTSSSRSTARRWSPAGRSCTAGRSASSPTRRACCSARRRRRRPSSSSSPTRSTPRCCSCTTPPATWSARSTSRAGSSSTAR